MSLIKVRAAKRHNAAIDEAGRTSVYFAPGFPEYSTRSESLRVKQFLIAWFLCFLVMETLGTIFVRSGVMLDFQQMYTSGRQVRSHPSQLYDMSQQVHLQRQVTAVNRFLPFYHPSYETLIFLPFSMLSYHAAYLAFIAFNMLLLMASYFVVQPSFSSAASGWRPEFLVFLFFPLLLAVALGQDSVLSLLLCCLTWRQLKSGKDVSAGCFLALALFKFQFVVPIAILIAIRRGWRFSAGFLIAAAGVVLLCIGIGGPAGMAAYIRLLHLAAPTVDNSSPAHQWVKEMPLAMPNLSGLLYACGVRFLRSPVVFTSVIGVCSLGLFAWCAGVVRRCEENVAFSVAILCGLMVSYHFYLYDLTVALLPIALLTGRVHRYLVIVAFVLPFFLFHFGLNWYFVMAAPMLAMLANAIVSTRNSAKPLPNNG